MNVLQENLYYVLAALLYDEATGAYGNFGNGNYGNENYGNENLEMKIWK